MWTLLWMLCQSWRRSAPREDLPPKKNGAPVTNGAHRGFRRSAFAAVFLTIFVGLANSGCRREAGDDASPKRVITLTPSATELAAAVGALALLVGVDEYSTYPAGVNDLPKVGSFLSPDFETIVRLKPDLVITDDVHAEVAAALGDAGIKTLMADMHSLADV